jgi:hypothetical protein
MTITRVSACKVTIDADRRPEMIFEDIRRSVEDSPWT